MNLFCCNTILADLTQWSTYGKTRITILTLNEPEIIYFIHLVWRFCSGGLFHFISIFSIIFLVLFRRSIELCQRKPKADKKEENQDYEKAKAPVDSAKIDDDVNDQYMELEDPKFAGYMNQVTN